MGRYEALEEDFGKLCRLLNTSGSLEKSNSSKHKDYRTYYKSEKMIETIGQIYSVDCENFSYEFDLDKP